MAYQVTITYEPSKDIFNIRTAIENPVTGTQMPVTPFSIPGLSHGETPSDAYIYADNSATTPVYNKELLSEVTAAGVAANNEAPDTYATYLTGSQKRWPKQVTDNILSIIEAYATPHIPVYRAWQTIKLAVEGGSKTIIADTTAQAEFYREACKALTQYGISVDIQESADDKKD